MNSKKKLPGKIYRAHISMHTHPREHFYFCVRPYILYNTAYGIYTWYPTQRLEIIIFRQYFEEIE